MTNAVEEHHTNCPYAIRPGEAFLGPKNEWRCRLDVLGDHAFAKNDLHCLEQMITACAQIMCETMPYSNRPVYDFQRRPASEQDQGHVGSDHGTIFEKNRF